MSSSDDHSGGASTRRGLLGLAGAALVGVLGGALGRAGEARAADGGSLLIGEENVGGAATTKLTTTATIASGAALAVAGANAQSGVYGSGRDIGVYGSAPIGVYGEGAVGGVFSGTDAAVSLTPAAAAGSPTGVAVKGDLMVDSAGVLRLCVANGTPGTWIAVSHGGIRPLPEPKRLYDSRLVGGEFAGFSTRDIDVVTANIGVPAEAVAIVANLTVTQTHDYGFLTAYPTGVPRPITSNLNWNPAQTIANSATIRLGIGGQISLYVELSRAHVIVDVAAYVL
jgi:hypothetical protein